MAKAAVRPLKNKNRKLRGTHSNHSKRGSIKVNLERFFISTGVAYVATGQKETLVGGKAGELGYIREGVIDKAVAKYESVDKKDNLIKSWTRGKKIVNIGDTKFFSVPGVSVKSHFYPNQEESNVNKIADELSLELNTPILVYKNILDAFNYNSNNGGKAYAISSDNVELSLAGVKMLNGFKRSFFQNKASIATSMNIEKGNSFALSIGPVIENIKLELFKANQKPTLQNIADRLEEQGVVLPSGKKVWAPAAVKRVFNKYKALSK